MALATRPPGQNSTHSAEGNTGPETPDTGRAAYLGITERGPADVALAIDSYAEFTRRYGQPISTSVLPEQVEQHFVRGGGPIVVGRNLGVGAARASVNIPGASGTTLVLTAADYGTHANSYTVDRIVVGATFQLVVYDENDEVIADTGLVATRDEVPDLLANNIYVTAAISAGSGDATAGTGTAFTGGLNGTTSDVSAQTALDLLGPELGTLQVCFPGDTSLTRLAQVRLACVSGEGPQRTPVFDHADASASTTVSAIEAQWDDPGVPAVHCVSSAPVGTSGILYGSVAFCAAKSASDRVRVAGHSIAASRGTFPGLTSLTREFTYAERLALENAGATVMVLDQPDARGVRNVMINSDRVGTDPSVDGNLIEASDLLVGNALDVFVRAAQLKYRFDNLTDETLGRIHSDSSAVGIPYVSEGVLSTDPDGNGDTGVYSDAFYVQVSKTGPREVTTAVHYRPSKGVAFQQINIVRREA